MPTWSEILQELKTETAKHGPVAIDLVRRKYLAQLATHTGRDTILYATKWTDPGGISPDLISITREDVQAFMEVVYGLKSENLDLIFHSPGGSPEATEAIVTYLRSKFKDIRIVVPQAAMSAATMLACAADTIILARHSSLGPVDPQMILQTQLGIRAIPAQAILDQFKMARRECKDAKKLASWLPILSQYGPALLVECRNALSLSKRLTQDWLVKYMFAGQQEANLKARKVASILTAHARFKSHGRHIDRIQARIMGLHIQELEDDQILQDLVLSVFHATTHTFSATPVVKIVENCRGRAFIKRSQQLQLQVAPAPQPPPPQPQQPPSQQLIPV